MIYPNLIVEGLEELADAELQERLWSGRDPGRISSLVECIEEVFDDSGLARALDRGAVFGGRVDDDFRHLSRLVAKVNEHQSVSGLLIDPDFLVCRRLARRILDEWSAGTAAAG